MPQYSILLSIVVIVRDQGDQLRSMLPRLGEIASELASDYELVIVDNASDDDSLSVLKSLTREGGLPNLQVFAMTKEVDTDTAICVGLENALGDFMIVFNPLYDDPAVFQNMLEPALTGSDVVFANNTRRVDSGWAYRAAFSLFGMAYKWLNGVNIARDAPQYRLLSRSVVNFILQHPTPALTYRHLPATGGFSKTRIDYGSDRVVVARKSLWHAIDRGSRLLVSSSRAPIRLVSSLTLFGALANVVYSAYVIVIALVKESVAPGWVTLSLQQSGMFLLMSLVLFVLGEYIMHIASTSDQGPAYHVGQEFTSAVMKRREKLNIEVAAGDMPRVDALESSPERVASEHDA